MSFRQDWAMARCRNDIVNIRNNGRRISQTADTQIHIGSVGQKAPKDEYFVPEAIAAEREASKRLYVVETFVARVCDSLAADGVLLAIYPPIYL